MPVDNLPVFHTFLENRPVMQKRMCLSIGTLIEFVVIPADSLPPHFIGGTSDSSLLPT